MSRPNPTPDELLTSALTNPESFDSARTARLIAQLERDDPQVRRAASWAIRFVTAESPSLADRCAGRFRRALRNTDAQSDVLRTLSVVAEHNPEAVAEILDGAVEEDIIDRFVGRNVIAGYRPPEPGSDGTVIADEGDEMAPGTETVGTEEDEERGGSEQKGSGSDTASSEESDGTSLGRPPTNSPAKPPRLDRSLTAYEPITPDTQIGGRLHAVVRFAVDGREFTGIRQRLQAIDGVDRDAFHSAVNRWCRIDDHDAVVSVIDHGTQPTPWLVTERSTTESLTERDTPLSSPEARWVLYQIADALSYAHAAGVLHGGLHPGTVASAETVEDADAWKYPRVDDWQLDNLFGSSEPHADVPRRYAAPEHVSPDRFGGVDTASDIYGVGVIGYQLLTGRAPLRDGGEIRPASAVAPNVPDRLSTTLTKCLRTAKMERYASAAALKRDLAAADNR
ncbi:serine/threonine protein kinase [Halorubrum sp. N11]|uniref:serine/threonine protein kinase n=1 Tax=Halorubrum sp. N11 TaxID=3402276 RepID=UPI003EB7AFBF